MARGDLIIGTGPGPSPGGGAEEADADQGAGQVEQPPEQVRPPLVADPEAAAPQEPCLGPLDHPPIPSQPFARLDPPSRQARGDAASAQDAAQR